jgi:hypothetical protein
MTHNRFVIAPGVLVEKEQLIILTDIGFWSEHQDELKQWCLERDAVTAGMTVVLDSERTLIEFILRWS